MWHSLWWTSHRPLKQIRSDPTKQRAQSINKKSQPSSLLGYCVLILQVNGYFISKSMLWKLMIGRILRVNSLGAGLIRRARPLKQRGKPDWFYCLWTIWFSTGPGSSLCSICKGATERTEEGSSEVNTCSVGAETTSTITIIFSSVLSLFSQLDEYIFKNVQINTITLTLENWQALPSSDAQYVAQYGWYVFILYWHTDSYQDIAVQTQS